jgi:hypothetical protein
LKLRAKIQARFLVGEDLSLQAKRKKFKAVSCKLSAKIQARFLVGEDLSLQAKRKKFKAVSFKLSEDTSSFSGR